MSAMDHPTSALAALNDKELEILRLLAAGHTVKSIAASLDRTEGSINERLRDARRKTGIGSSRELARLLDAQKIWDRNIDLPAPGASTEEAIRPAIAGRIRSKGTIAMLATLSLAATGLAMMAADPAPQAAPAQAVEAGVTGPSSLAGRWALDVQRIPANERPQRVIISFRMSPERKWTSVVEIVGPDGSASRAESTAAVDGVPVPIMGNMGFIDTVALRQPAPGTLVMTLGKAGVPVSTRVYTLAKDGKTMTETIVWAGTSLPKLETTYFNRID